VPSPFVDEFIKDPTDCKTKYMCQPPPQIGGFFEIPHKLDECVNRDLPQLVTTTSYNTRTLENVTYRYVSKMLESLPPRDPNSSYFIHGDPGLVNDAFAICVCHTLPDTTWVVDGDGSDRELQRVVVDFVLAWEPTADTPVDLKNVEAVLLMLCDYYNVQRVTFDRWNSATSIQLLIENGIWAEDLSFSNAQQLAMYRNLKLLVHSNWIEWPEDEALLNELRFLKLENNKITHDAFGKDRADALAAAVWSATGEELSATQRLVRETMGDLRKNLNANGSYTTVGFTF